MEQVRDELRYALRRLRAAPTFTAVVVVTLALGIGANAAIFSVVDAVLLRPLPYRDPGRLVTIQHYYPTLPLEGPVSAPGFRDYRDRTRSFEAVGVESGFAVNLTGIGDPQRLQASKVSGDWFRALGVAPALGRAILPEDDEPGKEHVVVLSNGLWHRLFAGSRDVLGKPLQLNGETYTVVGVMPPWFRSFFNAPAELWVPVALEPQQFEGRRYTNEWLQAVARLKASVSLQKATEEMGRFADQIRRELPDSVPPPGAWTIRLRTLDDMGTHAVRPALLVLLGAVAIVLCIACGNVANLMLARGAARRKEVAIRAALGADRWALARPLLAESVVLALAGGALGLALARFGLGALLALSPDRLPRADEIHLDVRVVGFALALSVITGLLFGLAPALQGSRISLHDALREGGRSASAAAGHVLRRVLVVLEVALALTLLVGAGLLLKSFARLQNVDPGFDPRNLLTFEISLPKARYPAAATRMRFFDEVFARIEQLPGVKAVGATTEMPFGGDWSTGSFNIEGLVRQPGVSAPWGDIRLVSSGFFQTLRVPLLRGRTFSDADVPGSLPVAVVDEELVKKYFPGQDPLGRRVSPYAPAGQPIEWFTIVGVVGHTKHEGLDAEPRVQLYFSARQRQDHFGGSLAVAVRTARDPMAIAGDVRAAIRAVDPDQPLSRVRTMEDLLESSFGQRKLSLVLLGLFAVLALLLASIGIYGVMSYSVTQRTREMGIRMALGAQRGGVLKLVVAHGMRLAIAGIVLGALGALALTRVLQGQLYAVRPTDPATFAAVATILGMVALAATLLPALRATRVDPVVALREE